MVYIIVVSVTTLRYVAIMSRELMDVFVVAITEITKLGRRRRRRKKEPELEI